MKYNALFACAAVLLLPACLLSNDPDAVVDEEITLQTLAARAKAFDDLDSPDFQPTDSRDLPMGDDVEYTGIAVFGEEVITDYGYAMTARSRTAETDTVAPMAETKFLAVGAARIVANFSEGAVAVTADNFFQIDNPNDVDLKNFTGLETVRVMPESW